MFHIDDGATGWLMGTAQRNYWRVCFWMEFEDLVQDGFLTYYRIANKYDSVNSRAQIMRLFQVSYINHIHTIAKQRTIAFSFSFPMTELLEVWVSEAGLAESLVCNDHELSFFQAMLGQAPPVVKAVMKLIASPDGPRKLRSLYRVQLDGQRETMNDRLCRLLNLDQHVDVTETIAAYFGRA